jgi:hypothetical protein
MSLKNYLVLIGMFNFLGRILVSKQALFHSYLPFIDFLSQMMQFYKFVWANLIETYFRLLQTFSSTLPY